MGFHGLLRDLLFFLYITIFGAETGAEVELKVNVNLPPPQHNICSFLLF
jgi:hypothetical protein